MKRLSIGEILWESPREKLDVTIATLVDENGNHPIGIVGLRLSAESARLSSSFIVS